MIRLVTQLCKDHIREPLVPYTSGEPAGAGPDLRRADKVRELNCHVRCPADTDEADAATSMADFQQRLDQQVRDDGQSAAKGGGSTTELACK